MTQIAQMGKMDSPRSNAEGRGGKKTGTGIARLEGDAAVVENGDWRATPRRGELSIPFFHDRMPKGLSPSTLSSCLCAFVVNAIQNFLCVPLWPLWLHLLRLLTRGVNR